MANLVYANDYQQSQAIDDMQREIDQQQSVVDHYDAIRDSAWEARKSARENLILAKEYLLDAINSGDPEAVADAKTAVQQAQQVADDRVARYDAAQEAAAANQDLLDQLQQDLIDIQDADIDPDVDPELIGLGGSAAEGIDGEEEPLGDDENPDGPTEQDVLEYMSRNPEPPNQQVETSAATSRQTRVKPRKNPLHDYATYTYSIALFILTKEDINTLTVNPASWEPGTGPMGPGHVNTCLVASGGRNTGRYTRNKNFTDDFYFDNLKMTTMIGMNNRSKASNAIEISFTILEPYGMSLLDRIMQTAEDIRAPNFKAMPYLLEVEFYGFDDAGNAVQISDQRKRMPIQIIEMKIKVGSKGAEYAIKAIPWNHQALSQSAATTPINLEVKASTVGEFFRNNKSDRSAVASQDAKKMEAQSTIQRKEQADKEAADKSKAQAAGGAGGGRGGQGGPTAAQANGTAPSADARTPTDAEAVKAKGIVNHAFAVSSFCGGINAWYTDLILKKLRATADEIEFEFHPGPADCPFDIAKSKITVPENKDISRSAVKEDKPEDAAKAAAKDANRVFTDATAFAISAGTSIPQVIDMVMRNSTYITDQIKDPKNMQPQELAEKEGKPLWWYKVIPTVKVNEYDYALNKYSNTTTYHIIPYKVYDSKHPNGPAAAPRGAIKEYQYSYTGKNVDVLDLQIDFDTLFYTAVTAGAAKWQADQATVAAQQQEDSAAKAAKENPEAAKELVNRQLRLVSSQPQSTGVGGTQNGVKPVLAADIQKGLYSTPRGDMLNLKLKITGDPELIKQDDIYTNPGQGGYADSRDANGANQNGSVDMDTGEILALVEFKTIVDMDEKTGLPRQQVNPESSVFSGLYRMLDVENVFAGGKFEQTVNMVRVPDALNEASKNADAGKAQKSSQALGNKDSGASKDSRKPDSEEETERDYTPIEEPPPDSEEPASNESDEDNSDEDGFVDEADDPEEPDAQDLRSIDEEVDETPIEAGENAEEIGQPPNPFEDTTTQFA